MGPAAATTGRWQFGIVQASLEGYRIHAAAALLSVVVSSCYIGFSEQTALYRHTVACLCGELCMLQEKSGSIQPGQVNVFHL